MSSLFVKNVQLLGASPPNPHQRLSLEPRWGPLVHPQCSQKITAFEFSVEG